ncbi:MAG: ABC transporter permease [Fimbriimonadaceae bacterium]|nr:ABC transporter permease [Alphaproteobacteria bacterium]
MNIELFIKYAPRMLEGLAVTIELVVISVILGALLALPVAMARAGDNLALRGLSFIYVYFFRGTPLLAQTFLVYYGAGQFRETLQAAHLWWFFRDAFNCVVLTFTLNTAAYQAEILRGAIKAVHNGQWEAAAALGIGKRVAFLKIILPQAMTTALRPFGNEIILMIKGSAIASVVTIFDLMGTTRLAFARSFDFQVYLWAAILYLVIVEVMRRVWDKLEIRLTRHLRPAAG